MISVILCSSNAVAEKARIIENFGKVPLSFTVNTGQYDPQVKFTTRGSGCTMFFTQEGTTFLLNRESEASVSKRAAMKSVVFAGDPVHMLDKTVEYERFALKLKFLDANPNPAVTGDDRLPGNSNFFIGNDPSKWRTDVANYEKVRFSNLYDGIDLVYYGNNSSVKYDFIVKPGEDFSQILLTYDFGENVPGGTLTVNQNGEMVVSTPLGDIVERKPYCYQIIDGEKVAVDIRYNIIDNSLNRFAFHIGEYDPEYSLIIDPEIVFSTFIGGNSHDYGTDIAVDETGSVYVCGNTSSTDFPVLTDAYGLSNNGQADIFIIKINTSGNSLEYSTFIGGTDNEYVSGMTLDTAGNIYLTGFTQSSDFPTSSGAYDTSYNKKTDSFIVKLNTIGSALIYSTYFGGSDWDQVQDLAVDETGHVYVCGSTSSSDFPTTQGAYETSHNGFADVFVVCLHSTGNTLNFATLFGGSSYDSGIAIVIDDNDNVYVTGGTDSSDFPTTPGAYDTSHNGEFDAFAVKLIEGGTVIEYATLIGGSLGDQGGSIALIGNNVIILSGGTGSSDFPVTLGAYDTSYNAGGDVFIARLNTGGNEFGFATFLGGNSSEMLIDIAIDGIGNIYVTGETNSPDFPTTLGAFDTSYNGNNDAFIVKLNAAGSIINYSTFMGGSDTDRGYGIALDGTGNVYFTGSTSSTNFPTTTGGYDTSFNGLNGIDVFVTKISFVQSEASLTVTAPNGGEHWNAGTSKNITWTSANIDDVSIEYSTNNGSDWIPIINNTLSDGSYPWTIPATSSSKCLIKITDNLSGTISDISDNTFTISSHIKVNEPKPFEFALLPNHPNPFNPFTTIKFTLPLSEFTSLVIYNLSGQKVRTLFAEDFQPGAHSFVWDGKNEEGIAVSSGLYLSRLRSGKHTATGKMLLIK